MTLNEVFSQDYEGTDCAQSVRQIGAALAVLHSTRTDGFELQAPRPWLLTLLAQGDSTSSIHGSVLEQIKRFAPLRAFTDELGQRWPGTVMIHGDLRFSNVLAVRDPPYVRLLDWELAGLGDPLYDLGCLLAAVLADAAARGTDLQSAVRFFGLAYAEYRARAPNVSVVSATLVAYAALRLVQFAIEYAKSSLNCTDHCGRLLEAAQRLSETTGGSLGSSVADAVSSIQRD
jgi:aminoglycoside phosphotransferase (APT) family kinase protein